MFQFEHRPADKPHAQQRSQAKCGVRLTTHLDLKTKMWMQAMLGQKRGKARCTFGLATCLDLKIKLLMQCLVSKRSCKNSCKCVTVLLHFQMGIAGLHSAFSDFIWSLL